MDQEGESFSNRRPERKIIPENNALGAASVRLFAADRRDFYCPEGWRGRGGVPAFVRK
jgi:hypothetical protein